MRLKRITLILFALVVTLLIPISTNAKEIPQSVDAGETIIKPCLLLQIEAQREHVFYMNETHPSYIFVQHFDGEYDTNGNPIIYKGTLYVEGLLLNYPVKGQKEVIYKGILTAWV